VNVKNATKDDYPVSDVILIDAPCTGTGVMSKRADLRWRRSLENLQEMQQLQLEILQHMTNFVASNGRIIYSTCSMESEENWDVIDMFLEIRNDFEIVEPQKTELLPFIDDRGAVSTFPPRDGMDGVFGVILQKC
jgi:16S rRNA (cytosine967-C5)-methyltransferase